MPLAVVKEGDKVRVLRVSGSEVTKKHLGSLGFVPGVVVSVVAATGDTSGSSRCCWATGDNMIVAIHDSRIAVNGDVSRHVFVEPV